ncbi:MAG: transglutaminase domain-containing protein [Bacteroidales bacterium]|nr:transglutaminase domain-containing protein [Bacteroidales bacterium]
MNTLNKYFGLTGLLIGLILVQSTPATGQVVDSTFLKEFNSFNKQINQEFGIFIRHNDSVFLQFLQDSWKEFEGKQNPMPVSPKPVNQPVFIQPDVRENGNDSIYQEKINDQIITPNEENSIPEKDALESASGRSFSYFGTRITLPVSTGKLPVLSSVTREGITGFFSQASRCTELDEIVRSLRQKSDKVRLNDWGFASMLFQASRSLYYNVNEQILFTWVGLLHSGYNVKVGYSNHTVYLLFPSDVQLYTVSYTIDNKEYFVLEPGVVPSASEKVFIHQANYPGNKTDFSFKLTEAPEFNNQEEPRSLYSEKTFNINLNKNLLAFYQNYPPCDLDVYFNTPVSADVLKQLDAYFLPVLGNKNDAERVAWLLDFVPRTIRYKTDREQFGKERYLFPDATLFFPAADCEDRSVLFARLVKRYTKLEAIGLSYLMHVSVAVNLPECLGEDYIMFRSKRFYHCDPTYLGAGCGMAMKAVKNLIPEVVYQNF